MTKFGSTDTLIGSPQMYQELTLGKSEDGKIMKANGCANFVGICTVHFVCR